MKNLRQKRKILSAEDRIVKGWTALGCMTPIKPDGTNTLAFPPAPRRSGIENSSARRVFVPFKWFRSALGQWVLEHLSTLWVIPCKGRTSLFVFILKLRNYKSTLLILYVKLKLAIPAIWQWKRRVMICYRFFFGASQRSKSYEKFRKAFFDFNRKLFRQQKEMQAVEE